MVKTSRRAGERLALLAALITAACSSASEPREDEPGPPRKRVFVTSADYTGNIGGLTGGDSRCATRAAAAALEGVFTAWLSDATTSAIDRIPDVGPWYLVDRATLVFTSRENLTTTPAVPINQDETGATVGQDSRVWTGTPRGGIGAANASCDSWRSGTTASVGLSGSVTVNGWTDGAVGACNARWRLYCFER